MATVSMPLITEDLDKASRELRVKDVLAAKAKMWQQARTELTEASQSIEQGVRQVQGAGKWSDQNGAAFTQNNLDAKKNVDAWATTIGSSDIQATFSQLQTQISTNYQGVLANYNAAQKEFAAQLAAAVAGGMSPQALATLIDKRFHEQNLSGPVKALEDAYAQGIQAVNAAASGPEFGAKPNGNPGGTPNLQRSPGGGDQQQAQNGGGDQQQRGGGGGDQQQRGGGGGDQQQEQGGGDGAQDQQQGQEGQQPEGAGVEPGLSGGLGTAPTIPPGVTMPPAGPPPATGTGVMPPFMPIGGTGAAPGAGRFGGGGGGGGVRMPGVSVGGGTSSIPSAASPIGGAGASAAPAAAPGQIPGGAVTAGPGGGGGGGGIPPMMPPMGGMGAAAGIGGGGGPGGPGAVSRPRERRRDNGQTPGLPGLLTGKAGVGDPHAFRRNRTQESDIPTTVQLIDEDLWQVQEKAVAVTDQPAPVRRMRH